MAILLQRICWNGLGWRGPTGELYQKEKSYVGGTGFGHEDWNFNTNDVVNGFVYGYSYYPLRGQQPSCGYGPHDIYFFSISPNKERLLVGYYKGAHYLTDKEADDLKSRFLISEAFDRRVAELTALNLATITDANAARRKLQSDFALNVRLSPTDVIPFNPLRRLTSRDVEGRNPIQLTRYVRPVFLQSPPAGLPPAQDMVHRLIEDAYLRITPKQLRVVERRHNHLSNRFRSWLRGVGATEIVRERMGVDVQCTFNNESYLFELKTVYGVSIRHALRESIGQLLDYAWYPRRRTVTHLATVLDAKPSKDDLQWIRNLQRKGIEIGIFWLLGNDVFSARIGRTPLGETTRER